MSFAEQSRARKWRGNNFELIKTAHRSRDALNEFRIRDKIDFNWRSGGEIYLRISPMEPITRNSSNLIFLVPFRCGQSSFAVWCFGHIIAI